MRVTLNTELTAAGIVCSYSNRTDPDILRHLSFGIIRHHPEGWLSEPLPDVPCSLRRATYKAALFATVDAAEYHMLACAIDYAARIERGTAKLAELANGNRPSDWQRSEDGDGARPTSGFHGENQTEQH